MPWLVKNKESRRKDENLLLIHVPRCAGTSMVNAYDVEKRSKKGVNLGNRIGLTYFFYRYRLLEASNFPFKSYENFYAVCVALIAALVWVSYPNSDIWFCEGLVACPPSASLYLLVSCTFTFLLSTFVMNTSLSRVEFMRRFLMWFCGFVCRNCTCSHSWLHGIASDGFLMHFTANKMVDYGYIKQTDLVNSFAVVRNPYSRMVSIFMYNRRGPLESFEHFVKRWYAKWKVYNRTKETAEWKVYCHVLPMHEFTHKNGNRKVPVILYQEDLHVLALKEFKATQLYHKKYKNLPNKVLKCVQDLPKSNSRRGSKMWYDYYNQRTMDLVLTMYEEDFKLFGYTSIIEKRQDLVPKTVILAGSFRTVHEGMLDKSYFKVADDKIAIDVAEPNFATDDSDATAMA